MVEGGFGPFDKYWRPIDAFHQGEAKINGLTPEMNAEFGVGSMCISYCGGNKEEYAPALWAMLRQPGRYFTFDNDSTGSVYKTVGVLRSSSSFGQGSNMYQYNWRGNTEAANESNIPPVNDYGGAEGFSYSGFVMDDDDIGSNSVSEDYFEVELGKAKKIRCGDEITIVTYGMGVHWSLEILNKHDISADLIDLRTLIPYDKETIIESVKKTNRLVILEESWPFGNISTEITYQVQSQIFDYLDAPIEKINTADTPAPYSPVLLAEWLPNANDVIKSVKKVLYVS